MLNNSFTFITYPPRITRYTSATLFFIDSGRKKYPGVKNGNLLLRSHNLIINVLISAFPYRSSCCQNGINFHKSYEYKTTHDNSNNQHCMNIPVSKSNTIQGIVCQSLSRLCCLRTSRNEACLHGKQYGR